MSGEVQELIADSPPRDGREWDCQCARCGSSTDFEECPHCDPDFPGYVSYSSPTGEIFSLNKLNAKGAIYRGQPLKIPSGNAKTKSGVRSGWSLNSRKPRYFYTHENFYVITRYNQSVLYAMAVHELSQALAEKMTKQAL